MAKERLSKLQKWILEKCLIDSEISYRDIFNFFGKKHMRTKHEIWGEGHDLKKKLGENYENEYNIERVKSRSQYFNNGIWRGLKIIGKKELRITIYNVINITV